MALTVFYDTVNDKTLAYVKVGFNRFEAKGQWTEEEVKMTLRLVRNFPVGSWNRVPGTIQFAIALTIARMLEQARLSIQEFGDNEIYRSLARGQLSVGRIVAEQPDFVSGVEIIHLDPTTGVGDTYELVYDNAAQTLAWQKLGDTSTNTVLVREGTFDILDDTGNLFVRVRVRVDELPGEDRTESFLIEDVESADYLNRVAENYFDGRLSRATGESDAVYRQRILDFLEDIGNTRWGLQDRLSRAVAYEPRIEETREWDEDFFVAGKAAPGSDILSVGVETDAQTPVIIREGDSGTHLDAYIDESVPDTNFGTVDLTTGTGASNPTKTRSLLEFDLSPLPANALIFSATLELYAKTKQAGADNRTLNIHRIKQAWVEATATWNNSNSLFSPDIEGTIPTHLPTTGIDEYKVSTDLTALVQAWVDNAADPIEGKANHGVMVMDSVEADLDKRWTWGSREDVLAKRPILRVNYTTFTPGAVSVDSTLIAKAQGSMDTMFSGASSANYFVRARFKEETRQSVDFTPTLGSTADKFIATINDVNFIYVQQGGDGIPQVTAGLKAAIDAGDEPIAVADDGAKITVVQNVPGDAFAFVASATGTAGLTANETQANIADIEAGIDEMKPASRRVRSDTGYGVEIASFEAQDADIPSSGGATLVDAGTDFRGKALEFTTAGDERANFQFVVPDDYTGEGINVVIYYRGKWSGTPTGRALFAIEERNVVDDDVWDAALVELREFKARAPLDALAQQHTDIRKEFAVLDPTWTARDIIQLALVRKKTDPIDDLADSMLVHEMKLYKKT